MAEPRIYFVMGFHVNYYHSWRGDRDDDTGFGMDTRIIRKLIRIMDRANERGLRCGGTWDFDNYWTLEQIMPRYAADLLESIKRRVAEGHDEVIIDAWNNGMLSASTRMEFRENLKRTISNPQGSGIRDIFGDFTPVCRPQEMMWTQGLNELFLEQGITGLSLYYSCVPFDAFRNFAPKLSPNEMYNPLRLRSTESDAAMLLIPTYSHGDIADNNSLKRWLKRIRRLQLDGAIPGDALVYINMDADADVWTGLGAPKFLDWIPNLRGIDEYTEVLDQCPYAEYGTLGRYLADHEPVGEITLRQDMADGSFTGYSSWTEKEVNQRLWRISERARWFQRIAEHLSDPERAGAEARDQVRELLYGPERSYFENKLLLLSTTHFGMNSPAINEERAQVAFHLARGAQDKASEAARVAVQALPAPEAHERDLVGFRVVNQPKRQESDRIPAGVRVPIRFRLPAPLEVPPEKLALVTVDGLDADFDFIGDDGPGELIFVHVADNKPFTDYRLRTGSPARAGARVTASATRLAADSVQFELDADGRITSFRAGGEEFASESLLTLGLTYKVDGRRPVTFKTDRFKARAHGMGPRGSYAFLVLEAETAFTHRGAKRRAEAVYTLSLMAGLPYLFLDAEVRLPDTPREHGDISIQSRLKEKFDANWIEVMPLQLRPALHNEKGVRLRVWKHNYLGVTNYYDLDYGDIDPRNAQIDSCNNHVTDGWVAVSNRKKGLLISSNALINASPAYCPMRVRDRLGVQTVSLNPFGAYSGKQFSQLPEGSGTAARITVAVGAQHRPTAPSFNGRSIRARIMLAPYSGDGPREALRNEADYFSLPPAVLIRGGRGFELLVPDQVGAELEQAVADYELDRFRGWTYADFIEERNRDLAPVESKSHLPSLPPGLLIRAFIDSIKGLF